MSATVEALGATARQQGWHELAYTRRAIIRLLADPIGLIAISLFLLLIVIALFGPLFPIGDPYQIGVGPRLAGPSATLPLGTDSLGRSLLPRLVEGMRATLILATISVWLSLVIGVLVGTVSAYVGGVLDAIVIRLADVLFSFPALLFALLASVSLGPSSRAAIATIVFVMVPLVIRVVRAASLGIVGKDYVAAAEVAGASMPRVIAVHLVPNIAGVVAVQGTFTLSVAMLIESALSFLGLGIQPPQASLGSLVSDGLAYLFVQPGLVLIPGAVLALAILCVNLIGDTLRDLLDPQEARRLR